MKILESYARITKIIKIKEVHKRIMKILEYQEFHMRIMKNKKKNRIPSEKHEKSLKSWNFNE